MEVFKSLIRRIRIGGYGSSFDQLTLVFIRKECNKVNFENYSNKKWRTIEYEGIITKTAKEDDYHNIKKILMNRGQLFPKVFMKLSSDFRSEQRVMKEGDLVLERINLLPFSILSSFQIVEILVVNVVSRVEESIKMKESNRFQREKSNFILELSTTSYHDEIGSHSVEIEWIHDENIIKWKSCSKSCLNLPWPLNLYGYWLQDMAHKQATPFMESLLLVNNNDVHS
jgi:hypothetical protein